MPNIFISGSVSFNVSGSAEQTKSLVTALASNEHGLVFDYELDDIPCTFYMHPWHVVTGALSIDKAGAGFRVSFDGVAKVPVDKSAFDYLNKKESVLNISGVLGDRFSVYIDGDRKNLLRSPLKISKTIPKSITVSERSRADY